MKNIPPFNTTHGRHGSHQKEIQMEMVYYLNNSFKKSEWAPLIIALSQMHK